MRRLLAFALLAATAAGASFGAQASAIPRGWVALGGVNLDAYCSAVFGHNYKSALLGHTAGDWRCVPIVRHYGTPQRQISVQDACRMQYGRGDLLADANWSQPLSWQCYGPRNPGGSRPRPGGY